MLQRCLILLALLCLVPPATAGQVCADLPAAASADPAQSAALTGRVRETLENGPHKLVLLGRVGFDVARFGLRYTHLGVAWRDHPRGRWTVLHLLNRCGTSRSELSMNSLAEFFAAPLHAYEALLITPGPVFQTRLQENFFSGMAQQLHEREYSMIASPFSIRYQNSNQWLLEVVASTLAPMGQVVSREGAQEWLKGAGYQADEVAISDSERFNARMFNSLLRFNDHSAEETGAGRFQVVTVESVLRFLKTRDPRLTDSVIR